MDNSKVVSLIKRARNSSFSRYGDSVHIPIHNLIKSMELYTNSDKFNDYHKDKKKKESSVKEFLDVATPEFQRANNKWTKKMKIKFVENVLSGVKTNILLFQLKDEIDYKIIDGLQRTTALLDFLNGKFKVFDEFGIEDLKEVLSSFDSKVVITKYTFENWEEVGRFYIDMNENITHSKADIQKAKNWFLNEKNIVL